MSISDEDYINIARSCDEILASFLDLKEVVAISQLHIGRPYVGLNKRNIGMAKKNTFQILFALFEIFKYFLFFLFRPFFVKNYKHSFKENVKCDYFFVSHYTGENGSNSYYDSYFGEVVRQLRSAGKTCSVVFIDHTASKKSHVNSNGVTCPLINDCVNLKDLFSIYIRILKVIIFIKRNRRGEILVNNNLEIRDLLYSLLSYNTIRNLILSNKINRMVGQVDPKAVIITFEGHALERLIFKDTHQDRSERTVCIGYQHAPVFKYQHSIRRFLGDGYDPDYIFTSGSIPKKQLSVQLSEHVDKIKILGSSRYIGSRKQRFAKNYDAKFCLVAPEGNLKEANIIFSFSLECALRSNLGFIWRFPPMVDFSSLIKLNPRLSNLPKNISISQSSLVEDIEASEILLYRGSSVAVNAAAMGLLPIYYKLPNELSIDPLYELGSVRKVVENVESFLSSVSERNDEASFDQIVTYARGVYCPIHISTFEVVP